MAQQEPEWDLQKAIDIVTNQPDDVIVEYPKKTKKDLLELGISYSQALEIFSTLKPTSFDGVDFRSGRPTADVYKKTVNKQKIYIKFYLEDDNMMLLSFHKDRPKKHIRRIR